MEIKYRWERNECYMIVDAGGISPDHYQLRMLEHNRIDGLLKVQLQQINQQSEFCYTISGRQSMVQRYENVCISIENIKKLMAALNKTAEQLEEFLLNIDSLRLEPEWIYWKEEGDGLPEFCYYPEEVPEKSFREHVRMLLQYLLNKISHKDPDVVNAVYGLYQIGVKETFRMQDLMRFLFYGTEENEESGGEECLSLGLQEDMERITDDVYEAVDYEMPDEVRRRKRQKLKQQKQSKQNERQNQNHNPEERKSQKRQREQQQKPWKKQWRSLRQRRTADYILALLVAALASAAVLRLAFLWYGRREVMSEKKEIIHIGLICAIIIVSGIAIYKLIAKTDVSAAAMWESSEGIVDWEQEYGQKQSVFTDEYPAPERRAMPEQETMPEWKTVSEQGTIPARRNIQDQRDFPEATCVLTGLASPPAGGWRFRYQGEEDNIKDFFLDGKDGQIMVGKKLKAPDIGLNRSTVSRCHALFRIQNSICTVRDCGSTNGTYLDGDRLGREETRVLLPGSEIKFADVIFRVEETVGDENATTILTDL